MDKNIQAPRTALMKYLDGLLGSMVIYIHAPAGFGKTMSAYLWLKHRARISDIKESWISLDRHDNKSADFCKRFAVALSALQPQNEALRRVVEDRRFDAVPWEMAIHALGAYAVEKEQCFLVLDDLHVIVNEDILVNLPNLLLRLPRNISMIMLSRHMPPDTFSAMVMKGSLSIVDAKYLQFSDEEIKTFFSRNGRRITSKQAGEICKKTGGWAIGLRALLLAQEQSYTLNLTEKYLDSFLRTHVWERWNEDIHRFLKQVSVVPELDAALCEWLTAGDESMEKTDVAETLLALARDNAFLRETEAGKYRFHDLFREFLLQMLAEDGTAVLCAQYDKAGEYFFAQQDYFKAAEYYLNACNDDNVAKALYRMYDYKTASASIENTLNIIHQSIGSSIVEKHPFLLEVQAWTAFVEGRADDFEAYLDKYYALFSKIVLKNPRSVINLMLLRFIDHRDNVCDTMKRLKKMPLKKLVDIQAYTPSITNNQPYFHRSVRDFSEINRCPESGMAQFENSYGSVIGAEFAVLKELLWAGFHYEKSHADEALEYAFEAVKNIPGHCSAEVKFCAMMTLATTLHVSGQKEDANGVLSNVRDMIEEEGAFYLKPNLKAYQCRLKLADGDQMAARSYLRDFMLKLDDNPPLYKMYQYLTAARALIATDEHTKAVLLLVKLLQLAEHFRRPLDIIECRILLAIAYWKKNRGGAAAAIEHIEQATRVAYVYGYKQLFANDGADLVNILHRLHKRSAQRATPPSSHGSGDVPASFVKLLYVMALAESKHSKGFAGGKPQKSISFTDKQKTVMRFLCEGYSKNEIAVEMGLKPSGVKTHIDLVYNKLGVSTSVGAIQKVKELGLLTGVHA